MSAPGPRICFGQQPCGFFPRRFLVAKITAARRLQREIGGRIIFFYHDSDHDSRETQTILTHRKTGDLATLNFAFANKVQRKWSPLFCKRIPADWRDKTVRQLPAYVDEDLVEIFKSARTENVADFCLEMYSEMGLLEEIEIVRSGDPAVRAAACDVSNSFADLSYQNEVVRARLHGNVPRLHQGGDSFLDLPAPAALSKTQLSPTRDTRLSWMQSVIRCTHYVCGAGEQAYLDTSTAPEITFVPRDTIDRPNEAFTEQFPPGNR